MAAAAVVKLHDDEEPKTNRLRFVRFVHSVRIYPHNDVPDEVTTLRYDDTDGRRGLWNIVIKGDWIVLWHEDAKKPTLVPLLNVRCAEPWQ
jgi:hypothetical protein